LKSRKFDIVALQEVCWNNSVVRTFWDGHTIYQSCGNTHELGKAFIVMGKMQKWVIGCWPISPRMCRLRIKGRFFNISIINVHSPHLGSTDDDKDEFYAQLEREYDRCPTHDIKIVIGDFNAQVGQEEEFKPVIGRFSAHQRTNENGLRLIDFAASKNMAIRSTFFQHSLPHRYTWRSPNQTESQIDHVLIDGRHFSDITDVRAYRGANVDSDHYLVMVKMRPKLSVVNNIRYRRPPRYNLARLKQANVAASYAQSLEAALPEEDELDEAPLEDCWNTVKTAINSVAENVLGHVERSRRNEWFDEECQQVLDEKNAARVLMLRQATRQNVDRYKQKRRQQTQLFREKKRRLEEEECEELEQLHRSHETRKFYQKLNASRKGFVPRAEMCRDKDGRILTDDREVTERWKQHFNEHLNGVQEEDQDGEGGDVVGAANDEDVPPPTIEEVKDAIKQLKNNKSAGKDGIGAELIKMGPDKLAKCLHRLIVRIWDTEQLPEEWKDGVISPIYKKGDKLDCENYRAITVLNAAYKVLSRIIFLRLSPLTNEFVGSYQAGFIEGRSTTDQIFTLRQILQKCREYQVPTHHLFIDFKAAYDTIDRNELWNIMDEYGFPGKLTRLIKATMDGVQCCVKISGGLSGSFESRRGLRQGDGLSCLLFNIALEGVMRRAAYNMRGTIFNKSSQFICFADDVDIVGRRFEAVAENYTRLKREAERIGLRINTAKTKYMLAGGTEADRARLGSTVTIDGDEFEVVDEFVYLGSLVTADNDTSREIRRRIVSGSRAYYGLHKQLRSNRLSLRTKYTMYKTLIRPVVLYGHETWTMLEEDLRALGVFERRVLRTIYGGVQEDGVWRRRMNHELVQLTGEPSIEKVVKAGRIRWAGHVERMPDNYPAKMVFNANPGGTRRRGAQRARWLDQMEQDLASTDCPRGWRAVAADRERWRSIVFQAML
jgi:endonuclease/exonuclease/phosphatase family metal-dependent hydrolase